MKTAPNGAAAHPAAKSQPIENITFSHAADIVQAYVQQMTDNKLEESIAILHLAKLDLERILTDQRAQQREAHRNRMLAAAAAIVMQNRDAAAASGNSLPEQDKHQN